MKTIIQSLIILVIFTILTGGLYPLFITGAAQVFFPKQAAGSLVIKNGVTNGSLLIGQDFTNPGYFYCRPSYSDYNGGLSGGYNYGPASSNLTVLIKSRIKDVRKRENLPESAVLPADMVTASASGLDPDISLSNARLQAPRIAAARGISREEVDRLIEKTADKPFLGIFGGEKVNAVKLNLALDQRKTDR